MKGTERSESLRGLERIVRILEAIATRPRTMRQLADDLSINWTTTHRSVKSLERQQFLVRDHSRGVYSIGPRAFFIGGAYLESLPIVRIARSHCQRAAKRMRATAQLAQRHHDRSVVLISFDYQGEDFAPRTTTGFHYPLHCGAKGRVLLAYSPPEVIEEYLRRDLEALTPHTMTNNKQLRRELEKIRSQGYSACYRDIQLTSASVAAPVFDASGSILAAATLIGAFGQMKERSNEFAKVVVGLAHGISTAIGWRHTDFSLPPPAFSSSRKLTKNSAKQASKASHFTAIADRH